MPRRSGSLVLTGDAEVVVPVEAVERRIYVVRGQKVILDTDLAESYGVPTRHLNEQVKRNRKRFPTNFMFQLKAQETAVQEMTARRKRRRLVEELAHLNAHEERELSEEVFRGEPPWLEY